MQTSSRQSPDNVPHEQAGSAYRPDLFTWSITCLLLAVTSTIFVFGGTAGESGGLFGQVASVGFLLVALTMFLIGRAHRNHPR